MTVCAPPATGWPAQWPRPPLPRGPGCRPAGGAGRRRVGYPRPRHPHGTARRIPKRANREVSRRRIGGTHRQPTAQHGDGRAFPAGARAAGLPAAVAPLDRIRRRQGTIMNPQDDNRDEEQIEAMLSAAAHDAAPPDLAFLASAPTIDRRFPGCFPTLRFPQRKESPLYCYPPCPGRFASVVLARRHPVFVARPAGRWPGPRRGSGKSPPRPEHPLPDRPRWPDLRGLGRCGGPAEARGI